MSDDCALDKIACPRLSIRALKSVCRVKGISGYSNLDKDALAKKCCNEGGLADPDNFRVTTSSMKKKMVNQKSSDQVLKNVYGEIIKDRKLPFATKKKVCKAGSFPDNDSREVRNMLEKRGAYNMALQGELDLNCVKKCLDADGNVSCGVEIGKTSYSGDQGKILPFLFFGSYASGIDAKAMVYSDCKNDLPLFWKVLEELASMGSGSSWRNDCKKGDFQCGRTLAGSRDYNDSHMELDISYNCDVNDIRVDLEYESEKYDDRTFGGYEVEYDGWNQAKIEDNADKIVEDEGIEVPMSEIESIFPNAVKIEWEEPYFQEGDKSFDVISGFRVTYPPLNSDEDADELIQKIKKVRNDIGKYVGKSHSYSRSFF